MTLLDRVLEILFPSRAHEAIVRQSTIAFLTSLVQPEIFCSGDIAITHLLPYRDDTVKACIREAKFHGNGRAQSLLGAVLAYYLKEYCAVINDPERKNVVLIPIPLSKERQRERGYNQTEKIARRAVRILPTDQLTIARLLSRTRDTSPQTSLARKDRLQNMTHAFSVTGLVDSSVTYIVFDDVATTGATLLAADRTLREAGATTIHLLALTH